MHAYLSLSLYIYIYIYSYVYIYIYMYRRPTSYYNTSDYKARCLPVDFTLEILDPKSNRVARQN